MPTLIPLEELKGSVPRMYCPYCEKYRYWTMTSGLEGSNFGRYIIVSCRTCGGLACWAQ